MSGGRTSQRGTTESAVNFLSTSRVSVLFVSETRIGGVKMYRALEGGGTRPESCPWKAWTFDPEIEDFLQNLCRKGSNSGTHENSNFSLPL